MRIDSYGSLLSTNVATLEYALYTHGPLSVMVDAGNWQSYKGGIMYNCGTNLNHVVLLVGYTPDSWIIKNSWGTNWGESGFVRVNKNSGCGVLLYVYWPLVNGFNPSPNPNPNPNPNPGPTPDPTCNDSNQSCAYWAQNGECSKNPNYMKSNFVFFFSNISC